MLIKTCSKTFDYPCFSNTPLPNPARPQKVLVLLLILQFWKWVECNCTQQWSTFQQNTTIQSSTFSMKYVSGSLPRGTGGSQLSTTYVLLISEACTLVGGPGIWTSPVRLINGASVKQQITSWVSIRITAHLSDSTFLSCTAMLSCQELWYHLCCSPDQLNIDK